MLFLEKLWKIFFSNQSLYKKYKKKVFYPDSIFFNYINKTADSKKFKKVLSNYTTFMFSFVKLKIKKSNLIL